MSWGNMRGSMIPFVVDGGEVRVPEGASTMFRYGVEVWVDGVLELTVSGGAVILPSKQYSLPKAR